MNAKVDVIIVNWNSGQLLHDLFTSLSKTTDRNLIHQLIIVDNDSVDNSIATIEANPWGLPLKIIKSKHNLGFAKACNLGAKESEQKYLLFLNPDTLLFEGSIARAMDYLENPEHKNYGACGIQLVDRLNIPNRSCARIPTFTNFVYAALGLNVIFPKVLKGILKLEWGHANTQDVGHVIGAFYLVRTEIFKKLGGFDERYFLYYEDLDFSTTLKQNNYKIAFLADTRAVHIGGGCSQKIKAKRLSYSYLSKVKYINKHFPWYERIILNFLVIFVEPVMRSVFYILQLSFKESYVSLVGYFQFVMNAFSLPTSRSKYESS